MLLLTRTVTLALYDDETNDETAKNATGLCCKFRGLALL